MFSTSLVRNLATLRVAANIIITIIDTPRVRLSRRRFSALKKREPVVEYVVNKIRHAGKAPASTAEDSEEEGLGAPIKRKTLFFFFSSPRQFFPSSYDLEEREI